MERIQVLIEQSYKNAGIDRQQWDPKLGYQKNKVILDNLYRYYQSLYFKQPSAFLWCGLARLTGGQVMHGMENFCKLFRDPSAITVHIAAIAKEIFESLVWQHELYLYDKEELFTLCQTVDNMKPAYYSYGDCWKLIDKGTPGSISLGNKMMLRNEQLNTIQPHYDLMKQDAYAKYMVWLVRLVMRNIHPYHTRFIINQPWKDVTVFEHRWLWIDGEKGMWHTWQNIPIQERNRLIALSNQDVMDHRWGKRSYSTH